MSGISGIDGPGGVGRGVAASRRAGGSAGSFAAAAQVASSDATAPAPAPPAVALAGILALQDGESAAARDREVRKQGGILLDQLVRLQLALLDGAAGIDEAAVLTETLGGLPRAADPALASLMAQISLRARIELARRGIAIA